MARRGGELAGASGAGDDLLDVIVIGGGQAGLAMAWHLARQHVNFVVLEAGPEPGHVWRSRWDSPSFTSSGRRARSRMCS
jgi:cation diffusion facilitator CzcD-associated flavoprotein CzcO